jgi:hypothetical protein
VETKEAVNFEMIPSLTVYIGKGRAIVAARHATTDGILYEQENVSLLATGYSASDLGAAVKKAFTEFSVRAKDLRNAKKSDWAAFKASDCDSMKKFEAEFSRIDVAYLNPSGAVARAELRFPSDKDFGVFASFNPRLPDEEIGKSIVGLVQRLDRFST